MSSPVLDLLLAPVDALHQMRELGGPVVVWIFACCFVMWTLVFERLWYYRRVLPGQSRDLLLSWEQRAEHSSFASAAVRKAMISQLKNAMSANMQILKVLVPLSPLLGLLGTVSGMLDVFDSMAARGSADARSMASGVSEAMVCTLSGLAVSISGLYPVYYFNNRARLEGELLADKFTY